MIPTVLTIAGSDSSGGAGIQADLKAIAANGGYGASVLTAITAQNTTGVTLAEPVSPAMLRAQLDAVFDDLDVRAVKTGMLADGAVIEEVASALRVRRPPNYVCDPVMISKSGYPLVAAEAVATLRRRLLPLAALVMPNAFEAAALAEMRVETVADAEEAGRRLLACGARAALVKGGHLSGAPATDVLVTAAGTRVFPGEWIETRNTHGTGCTYSAAVATRLARGEALEEAIGAAKAFVTEAIRAGLSVGRGAGPTDPFYFLRDAAGAPARSGRDGHRRIHGRLMVITDETLQTRHGHVELARLAARGGADYIQYREKRMRATRDLVATAAAMREATRSEARGREVGVVVDDRADVALEAGMGALHLGRHDLDPATARRILGAEATIGGTANNLEEALRVAATPVDYLGVGPVFATATKANPAPVLGLDGLAAIARAVSLPVFAIGGITADRVREVLAAGAFGVAVVSAVAAREDPEAATAEFRRRLDEETRT